MKTKEELQAAVNDIRRVCEAYGVVLLPGYDHENGGYEIMLVEADDIANVDPHCIYFNGEIKPENLQLTNKIIDHLNRQDDGSKALDRFSVKGVGDVPDHTKPRITVHKHFEGIGEVNVESSVDVTSLDEVESLEFLKEYRTSRFQRFAIGLGDGPFGTLIAEYEGHASMVVGFIEGSKPEELLKKWPAKRGTQDGNL